MVHLSGSDEKHNKIMRRQLEKGSWKEHHHVKLVRRAVNGKERIKRLEDRCRRREELERQKKASPLQVIVLSSDESDDHKPVYIEWPQHERRKCSIFDQVQIAYDESISKADIYQERTDSQETVKKDVATELLVDKIKVDHIKKQICDKIGDKMKELNHKAINGRSNDIADVMATMKRLIDEIRALNQTDE